VKPLRVFKGSSGLNTRDPVDREFNPDRGVHGLAQAVNVDVESTGRVSRRGCIKSTVLTGSYHSLFAYDEICLVVKGTSLYLVSESLGETALRADLRPGERMSYVWVDGAVYYTNGYQNGVVKNGVDNTWTAVTYVGPTTSKVLDSPPLGHLVTYFRARIYIAVGDYVVVSEPFNYTVFRAGYNYDLHPSRVTMLRGLDDGLVLSNGSGLYFYKGNDYQDFNKMDVAPLSVVEGSDILVQRHVVGLPGKGEVLLFAAVSHAEKETYLCMLEGNGEYLNLTANRVDMPHTMLGASVLLGEQFICSLQA